MHLIDENLELKSFLLGIVKKDGRAQAVDHVREVESFYAIFGLEHKSIIVNVTDTETTMVASSTLFKQHAAAAGVPDHGWLACKAHILNSITKKNMIMIDQP